MTPDAERTVKAFFERLQAYRESPVGFSREILGIDPHPGQIKWLSESRRDENILVTGNRWGKSTIAAAKSIWKCVYRIGWARDQAKDLDRRGEPYRAINLAMTADQSRLVWFKAVGMLQSPIAKHLVKSVKMTPFPAIEFINGAILEAKSTSNNGERLLGNVFEHVNWDEVAFEKRFSYILENVLRMRVLDRAGTIDYTSTGNGRNEFGRYFLDAIGGKMPDVYAQSGRTQENSNINLERLEKNMARMPEKMRRQNIDGEIVDSGGDFFPTDDINAAIDENLDVRVFARDDEEREAHAIVYEDGKEWLARYPTHRYVHGWDLADKSDYTVGQTWDISSKPYTLVEFERFNRTGWAHVYGRIRVRQDKYGFGETYIDSTGVGDAVLGELSDIGAHGVKFTDNAMGTGKKSEMLASIQSMLSLRELRIPAIFVLLEELRFYTKPDTNLMTDCVMSLAVCTEGMRRGRGLYMVVGAG